MKGSFNKMIPAQKVDLFLSEHPRNLSDSERNPEDIATNQLLEISQEYSPFDALDYSPPKMEKISSTFSEKNQRQAIQCRYSESSKFAKTQLQWRKSSSRFIGGEEVCVMKPSKIINLTNYVMLDGKGMGDNGETPMEQIEDEKNTFNLQPSKNIVAFLRRRNLANIRQQANEQVRESYGVTHRSPKRLISSIQKMNMSCELRKKEEESPLKHHRVIDMEKVSSVSPEIRCSSPTFRNKRVTNYLRFRIGKP